MGIFGGGYTKPGKGVDKNEPKKKGFFLFLDILAHKFMKLLEVNCLYSLTSIIWLFILFILGGAVSDGTGITQTLAAKLQPASEGLTVSEIEDGVRITLQIVFAVGVFTLWGSGPASAAYSYINRCFTRGEHAWIVSDGLDKFKENFKQGMLVVLVDALVLILGINALYFYYGFYTVQGGILWLTLMYVTALALIIYTMMHPYLYHIMVTFKCGAGLLYKNALLITLAKLPGNFFTTLVSAAITILLFSFLNPFAAAFIMLVFGLCVTRYVTEFYAARVIERSILKDIEKKQAKIEYIGENE